MNIFRKLNEQEEVEFRQWARDNFRVGTEISSLWHPVAVAECEVMNSEAKNGIYTLTKKMINGIFAKAEGQYDYWNALYAAVVPNWENVESISNWPVANDVTHGYIWTCAHDFDEYVHPEVMPGGLWMNSGFGSGKGLEDWRISMNNCKVTYKPTTN